MVGQKLLRLDTPGGVVAPRPAVGVNVIDRRRTSSSPLGDRRLLKLFVHLCSWHMRSQTKKPRDLLKKAHKMITFAAAENLDEIDAAAVESHLSLITAGDDEVISERRPTITIAAPDFSKE
jgi:hypothetical protein